MDGQNSIRSAQFHIGELTMNGMRASKGLRLRPPNSLRIPANALLNSHLEKREESIK
jgi:hypothetical protein